MRKLITIDDINDSFHKLKQRGLGFLLSKININGIERTQKTFNDLDYVSADWWIIPKVLERWNFLVTGHKNLDYTTFFVENYLQHKKGLKLVSLGSGISANEIKLAQYSNFEEIICIDIAKDQMLEAEASAKRLGLKNISFVCADFNTYDIPKEYYDIVFFHSSLHHFDNMTHFVATTIKNSLKPNGLLVINEYVGPTRLQFPKSQILKINEALKLIPKTYRTRYKSNLLKKRFYGSGIIRMIIADPSECIDSAMILPAIHANFKTVVEKPYGGNILMNALKDISHHFADLDAPKTEVLESLFAFEDEYLKTNPSDFVFGVYEKL